MNAPMTSATTNVSRKVNGIPLHLVTFRGLNFLYFCPTINMMGEPMMLGRNQKTSGFHSFKIGTLEIFPRRMAVQIAM